MKDIIKTMVLHPSTDKLALLRPHISFFSGSDKGFDATMEFIEYFHVTSNGEFPNLNAFQLQASLENQEILWEYVKGLVEDESIPIIQDNADFFSKIEMAKQQVFQFRLLEQQNGLTSAMQVPGGKDEKLQAVSEVAIQIHSLVSSMNQEEKDSSSILYGDKAVEEFRADYRAIQEAKENDRLLYLDIGLSHFDEVKMKPGDLVTVCGYTSQGKSVWLRYLTYHLLVTYGLNVAFYTFEMEEPVIRRIFYLLHANNAAIYPNAKKISYDSYRQGTLTDEQLQHLESYAIPDFVNNPNYGTLRVIQPKERFTVKSLDASIRETEFKYMKLHAVAVDYLMLMAPNISENRTPGTSDFNQMFKDFKNLMLTHRDPTGAKSPLIGMTPAQIPRHRYEEALKNEGRYNIMAASDYNEIERSSDIMYTTLMTPEMQAAHLIRLQTQKNRDGVVPPDPADYFLDAQHGFQIYEKRQQAEDVVDRLRNLDI